MNKNIRDLLADCRIELRTLMRDFHKSELCRRIDEARVELARDDAPETATAVAVLATAAVSTDRVAQAWRLAAEDLRVTAPAIYQLLAKKVAQRLAAAATADAGASDAAVVVETTAAPRPVAAAEQAMAEAPAGAETQAKVDDHVAAQDAAPEIAAIAPELEIAPANPLAPSRDDLLAISRHKRRFTEAQREWCVGEALIRSGFTINPNDFIGGGDHAMALYLLESEAAAS